MSKVIVGFDASEQSDDALDLGHALAKVDGAELHVAVVLPRTRIPFEEAIAGGQVSAQLEERLYESAERRLGGAKFVRAVSMVRSAVDRPPEPSTSTRRTKMPI